MESWRMRSRLRKAVALIGNTRARHLLVTCGLLMGIFLAAATFGMLLDQRHRTIELAGRELQNLALILAEETDRSLQAVELVQTGLVARLRAMGIESADALRRDGGSVEIFQDLGDRILGLSQIAGAVDQRCVRQAAQLQP